MAGPKLNAEQKTALRKELREKMDARTPTAQIVESLAAKYGVVGETIRYYLKHPADGTNGKSRAAKNGKPRRRGRRSTKRKTAVARDVLRRAIHELSEGDLRRAIKAKGILVEYERARGQERDLARQHRAARTRANGLKRQVKRLMRS